MRRVNGMLDQAAASGTWTNLETLSAEWDQAIRAGRSVISPRARERGLGVLT